MFYISVGKLRNTNLTLIVEPIYYFKIRFLFILGTPYYSILEEQPFELDANEI